MTHEKPSPGSANPSGQWRACPSCSALLVEVQKDDVGYRDRWECRACGAQYMLRLVRAGKAVRV